MKSAKTNIPLYFQFYLNMKRLIILGEMPPGSRIPRIEELYRRHEVSHGTIRKALDLLENEGLITKKPRLGIFVSTAPNLTMWNPGVGLENFEDRMAMYDFRPLSDQWVRPPNRVFAVFSNQQKILTDGRMFKIKWLQIGKTDTARRVLNEAYIPTWLLDNLSLEKLRANPMMLSHEIQQYHLIGVRQILRPWYCDKEVAFHLHRPEGTPIFHRTLIPQICDGLAAAYIEQLTTAPSVEQYVAAPNDKEGENRKDM
jgi:GntR family transcriptional regulator